jgi:4-diphosphocytidyl-2-C-methyl-D-erythritol kinase
MEEMKIKSPAKINLGLRILGKRKDGFHEIETVMQMIDLCDDIVISKKDKGITVFCNDSSLCGEKNLAYRAAEMIKEKSRRIDGVDITIKKNIPVGAGLGGGSSNAASVLLGLNKIWELGYSQEELMEMAGVLGSDVPFFIDGPAAIAKGRGEILHSLEKPEKMYLLLVIPPVAISTKWAYKNINLKLTNRGNEGNLNQFNLSKIKTDIQRFLLNDLEEVVTKRLPEISEIKEKLISLGSTGASMSGSGSSVYGIFLKRDCCLKAYETMKKERWKVTVTETITDLGEISL